jgi:hypothetical protein
MDVVPFGSAAKIRTLAAFARALKRAAQAGVEDRARNGAMRAVRRTANRSWFRL